jgi:TetR/AcrR family transcriptional repressor of mexJK operon
MRIKTEAKRRAILDAAATVFRDRGYHATSLALVAASMGSSKATIYNYFPTKAELFSAVLMTDALPAIAALLRHFDDPAPFPRQLTEFARAYVHMNASEGAVAIQRLVVAERDLAQTFLQTMQTQPEMRDWPGVRHIFARQQEQGILGAGDVEEMVRQFRALLHGDLPMRLLIGERDSFTPQEMDASADSAVRFFLAAYGAK